MPLGSGFLHRQKRPSGEWGIDLANKDDKLKSLKALEARARERAASAPNPWAATVYLEAADDFAADICRLINGPECCSPRNLRARQLRAKRLEPSPDNAEA